MKTEAMVIFSGGQDSTTALAWAKREFAVVDAITFNYMQRHRHEIIAAERIAAKLGVRQWEIFDLQPFGALVSSALTRRTFPIETTGGLGNLPTTFTPGRNLVFLSLAASVAVSRGITDLVLGVCQTDYSGYPDCREMFIHSFEKTMNLALGDSPVVRVHTPLMYKTKGQTFELADELGILDVIMNDTVTCYRGDLTIQFWGHGCGICPACVLREKGWKEFREQQKARGGS